MPTPIQIIKQYAPKLGLDPAAVVAYSLTQGGTSWGAVGDHGTSFGPFQLHRGGALGAHDAAWANSPEGLRAAMGMMARAGAAGKKGPEAAAFIVGPSFGRGANPPRDMANARAAYGRAAQLVGRESNSSALPSDGPMAPAPQSQGTPTGPVPPTPEQLIPLLQRMFQKPGSSILAPIQAQGIPLPVTPRSTSPTQSSPPGRTSIGGPPLPWKAGTVNPKLLGVANQFGLKVTSGFRSVALQRELYKNRSRSGSVAAPGKSYHNHGRAIDVAPNAAALKFLAYAFAHPAQFKEVFYDPAGRYIKNGRIVKGSIGGHSDHVHIAT